MTITVVVRQNPIYHSGQWTEKWSISLSGEGTEEEVALVQSKLTEALSKENK